MNARYLKKIYKHQHPGQEVKGNFLSMFQCSQIEGTSYSAHDMYMDDWARDEKLRNYLYNHTILHYLTSNDPQDENYCSVCHGKGDVVEHFQTTNKARNLLLMTEYADRFERIRYQYNHCSRLDADLRWNWIIENYPTPRYNLEIGLTGASSIVCRIQPRVMEDEEMQEIAKELSQNRNLRPYTCISPSYVDIYLTEYDDFYD